MDGIIVAAAILTLVIGTGLYVRQIIVGDVPDDQGGESRHDRLGPCCLGDATGVARRSPRSLDGEAA